MAGKGLQGHIATPSTMLALNPRKPEAGERLMKKTAVVPAFLALSLLATSGIGRPPSAPRSDLGGPLLASRFRPVDECLPQPEIVAIREADPALDLDHHRRMRDLFIEKAQRPNTTIVLGPTVVLDFSTIEELPITIGRCVTITSVARFARPSGDTAGHRGDVATRRRMTAGRDTARDGTRARRGTDGAAADRATEVLREEEEPPAIPEARSSTAPGPLLRFGPHRRSGDQVFLLVRCFVGVPDQADHVRLSGFRIHGPSFGPQSVGDKGILIDKCTDVEISNMEIAGWGGEGIRVQDDANEYFTPPLLAEAWQLRRLPGACEEPPYNGPQGRIGSPDQVRIVGNYIHHNQQPRSTFDGHAGGYGVLVTFGAHAQISRNVFASNRHSIAAGGTMGGYQATENLVLRYGGIHYDGVITVHTHAFDIHGTGDNGFDGFAGARTTYSHNAFQYSAGNAISIRGSPRCGIEISHNVFPHRGLEADRGDDAVKLHYRQDLDVIKLGPGNSLGYNSYGKYAVCDFDGDGIDDLFLPTGVSWWFSGGGEFPWRFLARRSERLERLRFGYFDGDNKCDVLTETGGAWMISSGGTGAWYRLGQQYAPLSEVQFGRFDPNERDLRPGATRRTTHAFWRTPTGQWKVTTLNGPSQGWRDAQSSSLPMSALRFGDFNGDGVTDVLSVQGGRWAISPSAAGPWQNLNPTLGSDVRQLFVADIDNNNTDDLIRVRYRVTSLGQDAVRESYTWEVSDGGSTAWKPLKSYRWDGTALSVTRDPVLHVFAGRFGTAPGAGILTVDRSGTGRFYAPLEARFGANPDWNSTFAY